MVLKLLSSYYTRRTCLTIVDLLSSRSFNPGEHRKAELGQAGRSVSHVRFEQPRLVTATYDGDCAAASLLALSGTDVDEVLCAGGSGRG
jgi:hypothetical protein